MKKNSLSLLQLIAYLVIVGAISRLSAGWLTTTIEHSPDAELIGGFLSVALVLAMSFISYYLAREKPIPTFVSALLLGVAAKPLLLPLVENHHALALIVSLGATFILFQGGVETDRDNFKKLIWKIGALAFPGVLISAIGLSLVVAGLSWVTGLVVSATTAVLLGAVLASTDPAAIIPLLKPLKFKDNSTKDIVVSESALNDVVGALLTLTLVGLAVTSGGFPSISAGYAHLFGAESAIVLFKQMIFGTIAGVGGYALLKIFKERKKVHGFETGADGAFFLFVPLFAFVASLIFGGSGYLAAFFAGLLFRMSEDLKNTAHFYEEHLIDGYAKPTIFVLLGALVDPAALMHYAPIGIASALLFIFFLRPLMVVSMLGLFTVLGKERLSWSQIWFIGWVRETGAIPAVLLVTVVSLGLPGTEPLVPIGMWVILATLLIQPPLTPWLARKLELV